MANPVPPGIAAIWGNPNQNPFNMPLYGLPPPAPQLPPVHPLLKATFIPEQKDKRKGAGKTRRIQRISIPIDFDSPDAGYASL